MRQYMKSLQKRTEYALIAHTAHGIIKYDCKINTVDVGLIARYLDKKTYDMLCETGCPNYRNKWSCPPYAPCYTDFVIPYKYIDVVMLQIRMQEFDYIKQDYLKIKAANSVLKSRIDKALRLSKNSEEFYISTGSCRLCKPCKRKLNENCAHPKERTYSFEALGINVSALTLDLFETELQWYKKKNLPGYTCVVGGLLTNYVTNHDRIIKHLKQLG